VQHVGEDAGLGEELAGALALRDALLAQLDIR
jgi:hypothetical protein